MITLVFRSLLVPRLGSTSVTTQPPLHHRPLPALSSSGGPMRPLRGFFQRVVMPSSLVKHVTSCQHTKENLACLPEVSLSVKPLLAVATCPIMAAIMPSLSAVIRGFYTQHCIYFIQLHFKFNSSVFSQTTNVSC